MEKDFVASVVVRAFYAVYKELEYGFLERKDENALAFEMRERGLNVEQQKPITVFYKCQAVGEYFADLLVEGCVICELKALSALCEEHEAQLLNYLKATEIEVGLLLNFGTQAKIKRKAFDNAFKQPKNPRMESREARGDRAAVANEGSVPFTRNNMKQTKKTRIRFQGSGR